MTGYFYSFRSLIIQRRHILSLFCFIVVFAVIAAPLLSAFTLHFFLFPLFLVFSISYFLLSFLPCFITVIISTGDEAGSEGGTRTLSHLSTSPQTPERPREREKMKVRTLRERRKRRRRRARGYRR